MARKLTSTSCSGISIVVAALCTPAAANLVFASINQLMFYFTRVNSQQGGIIRQSCDRGLCQRTLCNDTLFAALSLTVESWQAV